ncbi:hypothetical protein ACFLZM_08660, partial [Thermodesulfobacteriota bacterium]
SASSCKETYRLRSLSTGVLWGIGRLAHARPGEMVIPFLFLVPYMRSNDAYHRGIAVWAAGVLHPGSAEPEIRRLTFDNVKIKLFRNNRLTEPRVAELAEEALLRLTVKR